MLNRDFSDMLSLLNECNVEYLLVGAYALAAMGHPRATGDLDIFINPTSENAVKVMLVLKKFGAPLRNLTVEDLQTPGIIFQIGVSPVRIDILTELTGVSFAEAWASRQKLKVDGIDLGVIGKKAFIKNKKAMGRHKDLADIELIESLE